MMFTSACLFHFAWIEAGEIKRKAKKEELFNNPPLLSEHLKQGHSYSSCLDTT